MTTEPTSADGQPLGKRGIQTRRRILEAVASAIERDGLRGLRLADVATEVGFSAPAFYQYFNDLDEAILALCEEVGDILPDFDLDAVAPHSGPMPVSSRPYVDRFLDYWNRHRALLWSRNAALTAGDDRFREVRNETFRPMLMSLERRIVRGQEAGRIDPDLSPVALAAMLTIMIDRAGMIEPQLVELWGGDDPTVINAAVAFVFDRVLGIEAPDEEPTPGHASGKGSARA